MARAKKSKNKESATAGSEKPTVEMIKVHIMGKLYKVPYGVTIMEAFEYAGYRFTRGAGCRAGFCGACGTIYRLEGDHKLYTALACQTSAEDGMYLAQIPYSTANRAKYNIEDVEPSSNVLLELYPVIAKCVSCNTCTRACPQELEVMDYVQTALRGDIQKTASLSFDCIQCGLCAIRCPAEIPQYHVAQVARRIYGKYIAKRNDQLNKRVKEIDNGDYDKGFEEYFTISVEELKEIYVKRDLENIKKAT